MMTALWIILALWIVVWLLVNLPRGRPDGTAVGRLHPYRKMLFFVMPGRNESVVYYDTYVRAEALLDYVERMRAHYHVDVTHCLVYAVVVGLRANPKMNRFIAGQRMYQRNHDAVTFSMKRRKLDKEAKISAVKLVVEQDEDFEDVCRRVNEQIGVERSDRVTHTDKEIGFFARLPRPLMRWAMGVVRWADYHNLVPRSWIDGDGFYTSVFVANLGSLGMDPGYHHLYEYGTCPLFMMVGKIEERPVVEHGQLAVGKVMHVRWSYDERIDDGLTAGHGIESVKRALEHPEQYLAPVPGDEDAEPEPDDDVEFGPDDEDAEPEPDDE